MTVEVVFETTTGKLTPFDKADGGWGDAKHS